MVRARPPLGSVASIAQRSRDDYDTHGGFMLLDKVNNDAAIQGRLSATDLRQVRRIPVMAASCVAVALASDGCPIITNIDNVANFIGGTAGRS